MHTPPLRRNSASSFPIFAFTHCRDVVVAVSKAGVSGVLAPWASPPKNSRSSSSGSTNTSATARTLGVDIVIPNKYEAWTRTCSADELTKMLQSMVSAGHLGLRTQDPHRPRVPLPEGRQRQRRCQLLGWTEATATPQSRCSAAPQCDPHRQRTRHPAGRDDRPHPRGRTQGRGPCAARLTRRAACRCGPSTSSLPRARGWRALRCEVGSIVLWPQYRQEVRTRPRAGGRGIGSCQQSRQRSRWRPGRGRLAGLMVEEAETLRPAAAYAKCEQPRHRSQPLLHRQAVPDAAQTTVPRRGSRKATRAARDAAAVHGVRHGRRRHPQYPDETIDVAFNPWALSSPVHQVEKTSGGHRACGCMIPGGDRTLEPLNAAARSLTDFHRGHSSAASGRSLLVATADAGARHHPRPPRNLGPTASSAVSTRTPVGLRHRRPLSRLERYGQLLVRLLCRDWSTQRPRA